MTTLETFDPGCDGRLGGSQDRIVQEDDVEQEGDEEEGRGEVEECCTCQALVCHLLAKFALQKLAKRTSSHQYGIP